ncbi:MAG: hypothetical protein MJA28_06905 [Gammaproteobacteria bacterium]|nr:hypothetical protein [Gammaproteobacteria bacterium]
MLKQQIRYVVAIWLLLGVTGSWAGEVSILDVIVKPAGSGRYHINVTLKHTDTGWAHYADRWDVLDEQGAVIGQRILHHPHVDEQPFTRGLTLSIPEHVKQITIRAHDKVHGLSPQEKTVRLKD